MKCFSPVWDFIFRARTTKATALNEQIFLAEVREYIKVCRGSNSESTGRNEGLEEKKDQPLRISRFIQPPVSKFSSHTSHNLLTFEISGLFGSEQ